MLTANQNQLQVRLQNGEEKQAKLREELVIQRTEINEHTDKIDDLNYRVDNLEKKFFMVRAIAGISCLILAGYFAFVSTQIRDEVKIGIFVVAAILFLGLGESLIKLSPQLLRVLAAASNNNFRNITGDIFDEPRRMQLS